MRETFFVPEITTFAKYMPWFRHHEKSYKLSVEHLYPNILRLDDNIDADTNAEYQPKIMIPRYYLQSAYATPYTYPLIVSQTTPRHYFTEVAHLCNHLLLE
ncbi:hypothetical protein J1N35_001619 [Gossypium stocksii]|uniref:Uncharacterized protein n=1 Tax=Gossypium stocksii TaxID=47602 RepID=A0A9D3WJV4_9ROSI|nr:hypothetical protein J1N35_001619 [Gossypium stocksii]